MNNLNFNLNKDKPLIPNSLLENMFLRIATDQTITQYLNFIRQKNTGLATAYISNIVYKKFMEVINHEKT